MDNNFFEKDSFSLEAMACDDSKAEQFADYLEARGLYTAPANLKSSILERSCQMDIQLIAGAGRLSKKAELLRYGLKVSFVAACSIAAIIAMPQPNSRQSVLQPISRYTPIYVEAYEKVQEWNEKIDEFSKLLFYMEVPLHDE